MRKSIIVILVLCLIIGVYYFFALQRNPDIEFQDIDPSKLPDKKVIIIGVDGATWDILQPLIDSGEAPNFKALIERGTKADLYTDYSSHSPAIWTSVVTGKLPEKHGIQDFLVNVPGKYEEIPVSSSNRKTNALWNILSRFDKKNAIVAWWGSWPAENVKGFIVTQKFFLNAFQAGPVGVENDMGLGKVGMSYKENNEKLTYPIELTEQLKTDLEKSAITEFNSLDYFSGLKRMMDSEKDSVRLKHLGTLLNIGEADFLALHALKYLINKDRGINFQAVYFEGVDASSHFFWKDMEEKQKNMESLYGNIIEDYYKLVDSYVADILDASGSDVNVLVISDHGFQARPDAGSRVFYFNKVLEKMGFLKMLSEGEIDYANSLCFDSQGLPRNNIRELRINYSSIYPDGKVKTEEDAQKIYEDLKSKLQNLKLNDGKELVEEISYDSPGKIIKIKVKYKMDSDDTVNFDDGKARIDELFDMYDISGGHNPKGIMIAAGPDIRKGAEVSREVTTLDITPTLLSIFGLPLAEDMDGKAINEILKEQGDVKGFMGKIDSYDKYIPLQNAGKNMMDEDKLMKERLKSLGYIN